MLDKDIHEIQRLILRELLFKSEASFSDLNVKKVSSDQFSFHIKRLTHSGLIEKTNDGLYQLSNQGKDFANRHDMVGGSASAKYQLQAKLSVLVCGVDVSGKEPKYLVFQRLASPHRDFHGFITGKVRFGEKVVEAAARELESKAGHTGTFEMRGVMHKMDYSHDGELLQDKFLHIVKVTGLEGDLREEIEGGKSVWYSEREIRQLPKVHDGMYEVIGLLNGSELKFFERKYVIEGF